MAPASPRVSVIIPTSNGAALLKRSIASVLAQTFRDLALSSLRTARATAGATRSSDSRTCPSLDVRRGEDPRDAVRFPGRAPLDHTHAVADDLTEFAPGGPGHGVPSEQAEFEEVGEPLAVAPVRRVAHNDRHVPCIQHDLEGLGL